MDPSQMSPHSPLQNLDLNRGEQHRPRPGKAFNARGTSPNDVLRPNLAFSYSPSAPPLSIERGERIQRPAKPGLEGRTSRAAGSSSFSPSSASSYGSVIGSQWYGGQGGVGWSAGQGSSRGLTTRHGLQTDENDYGIAARLAPVSTDGQNVGLSPARMQRQLSSRSNDGILFPAEDLDFNQHHRATYTPTESPAPPRTVIPNSSPWQLHEEEATSFAKRRVSAEKHASGLESPWKSPGWKVREREDVGARVRERAGSLLGMTVEEEENEIPKLSQRLSNFYMTKRRLSTSPKTSRTLEGNRHPNPSPSASPDIKESRLNINTAANRTPVEGLPSLHHSHSNSFSPKSPAYEAISPLSPTFQHTSLHGATPLNAPSSSGLPSRRYIAQPRALRLSVSGASARQRPLAREALGNPPKSSCAYSGVKGAQRMLGEKAEGRGVLASPFGARFAGELVSPESRRIERQSGHAAFVAPLGDASGRINEDSIEEEQAGDEGVPEVPNSVKKRIRDWALDTMQRAEDLPTSVSFPKILEQEDVLPERSPLHVTHRTNDQQPLQPPELPSFPSDETVKTTLTDSSGNGIPPSPTPWNGIKRVLAPTSRSQEPIGLGIFAGDDTYSPFQQGKRGNRDMVVQVQEATERNAILSTSPTPSPGAACFKLKSHSSSAVPTLRSLNADSAIEEERPRKQSSTDSVCSGVLYTMNSKTPEEQEPFSRRASSKLSFNSIKALARKPSPLLEYRSQFTPPPCRSTFSPQMNGPDDPSSPFEASSDSTNSRGNSFLRELQASTNRPPIARRTTAPAKGSPKELPEIPALPSNANVNIQTFSQASQAPPLPFLGTPVHVFDSERPSPAAFMSTGLIKKGSGFSSTRFGSDHSGPTSVIDSTGSLPNSLGKIRAANFLPDSPDLRTPDTPIKGHPLVAPSLPSSNLKPRLIPLMLSKNNTSTAPLVPTSLGICTNPSPDRQSASPRDDQSSLPAGDSNGTISGNSAKFPSGTGRGLRRKGSAMWARTNSGNWSNGSWSRQTTVPMDEDEPLTPTRNDDRAVIKLDFSTITPSPPAACSRHYPFAPSVNLSKMYVSNSPTSPLKKGGFLHRALARVSNPMLSASYKQLGEQQVSLRGTGLMVPGAEGNNIGKTARRVSTSSIGGADTRFERDFVLLGPIGVGEFSTVWKVREKRNGTVWAVKRGKPYIGEKDRKRQLEEVAILSTLAAASHPNVLRFQEAWEEKSQLHIRTALAECGDFATYLQSISDGGGLDEGRCWKVLHELTEGLRHIHSLGILHLDLKPANILINQSGTLQISDFGLSIRLASLTSDGCPVIPEGDVNVREGDREYLSPEMLKGVYGTFSDVFSLGATMLEVAFNIVLPSNGDAWQKLRNDDFSDLEEHYGPLGFDNDMAFATLASSVSSGCTLASDAPVKIGNVSLELFAVIRGLMSSNHTRRSTLRQLTRCEPIRRMLAAPTSPLCDARISVESRTRSSVDEWEEWSRQRARENELSPETTRVHLPTLDTGRHVPKLTKPALVHEDSDFLNQLLDAQ